MESFMVHGSTRHFESPTHTCTYMSGTSDVDRGQPLNRIGCFNCPLCSKVSLQGTSWGWGWGVLSVKPL